MRTLICVFAYFLISQPTLAQTDRAAAAFWQGVQARCDATAATPADALGRRIAQTALDEARLFGGHRIDANGRLVRFGLTEAEHNRDGDAEPEAQLGKLGWRQVMKYWRTLYGDDALNILEVRGYSDASTSANDADVAKLLRDDLGPLLRAVDGVSDLGSREIVREALIRTAIIDTPWSAVFISYVMRQAGVPANAFDFAFAHRAYIYGAFTTSAAETSGEAGSRVYRACPLETTKPRAGDLICFQRDSDLADASAEAVRERIRAEAGGPPERRSVRNTHCEVIASVDRKARTMHTVGGNVSDAVTVRTLKLGRRLTFSPAQQRNCGRSGEWSLPEVSPMPPGARKPRDECSLNDRRWFVLLQLR